MYSLHAEMDTGHGGGSDYGHTTGFHRHKSSSAPPKAISTPVGFRSGDPPSGKMERCAPVAEYQQAIVYKFASTPADPREVVTGRTHRAMTPEPSPTEPQALRSQLYGHIPFRLLDQISPTRHEAPPRYAAIRRTSLSMLFFRCGGGRIAFTDGWIESTRGTLPPFRLSFYEYFTH